MFKDIAPILIALIVALVGGIYSADKITDEFEGFSALTYGSWTAWPNAGSPDADPYARARAARTGTIALGSAEGLQFVAQTDDSGRPIRGNCEYTISGKTPPARFWTLRMLDEQSFSAQNADRSQNAMSSTSTLRNDGGSIEIHVANTVKPGNWLQFTASSSQRFLMTLYDTSVASTTGVTQISMPKIIRTGCANG